MVNHLQGAEVIYRKSAQIHIFRNRTGKYRLQLLMYHRYAFFHRFVRIVDFHLFPVQVDFSLIHLINAEKAFHQGGLSCTIFPHKGMDCTRTDRKLHIVQRLNTRK